MGLCRWLNLLAKISKGIKGSRGGINWTMVYCNHVSFAAFFLHFHDQLRICNTKCSSVHHLSTKAFLWPSELGHASHSFVFTCAIFSLPACTLTVQCYKAAVGGAVVAVVHNHLFMCWPLGAQNSNHNPHLGYLWKGKVKYILGLYYIVGVLYMRSRRYKKIRITEH